VADPYDWLIALSPRFATDASLVRRYDSLVDKLLTTKSIERWLLVAEIGPVAREIQRRNLWPSVKTYKW
jgi:hypothetical protein